MNEEKMTVLRMLAEGKINAEEAARLLEALGEEEPSAREWPWERMMRHAERKARHWQERVGRGWFLGPFMRWEGTLHGDPFESGFDRSPQSLPASEGMTLRITSAMGDVQLIGTDEPNIRIEGAPRRHYRVEQRDKVVEIHAARVGAGLTIYVPAMVDEVAVQSHLGEIAAKGLRNPNVNLMAHTGEVSLELGAVQEGSVRLRSHVGNVTLYLPRSARCEVRAMSENVGEVHNDSPLEVVEQGAGFLHGTLNGGGADVRLVTHTGEIYILGTEEPSART